MLRCEVPEAKHLAPSGCVTNAILLPASGAAFLGAQLSAGLAILLQLNPYSQVGGRCLACMTVHKFRRRRA